jgi:hypothetical protein
VRLGRHACCWHVLGSFKSTEVIRLFINKYRVRLKFIQLFQDEKIIERQTRYILPTCKGRRVESKECLQTLAPGSAIPYF